MNKPHVICHMLTSVDGKILVNNWGDNDQVKQFTKVYESVHDTFDSDAWICGRVTMEKDFTKGRQPALKENGGPAGRADFVAAHNADSFAIAVDADGKLGWDTDSIDDDHIIEVLTEKVSDAYLLYLKEMQISYVFGGKDSIDFTIVLEKLYRLFKIKILMLEGGGHLNGSFLAAGLIDELSLLIAPIADGSNATGVLEKENVPQASPPANMELAELKQLEGGIVWLTYKLDNSAQTM